MGVWAMRTIHHPLIITYAQSWCSWLAFVAVCRMYDEVLRSVDEELRSKGLPKAVDPATVKARPQKLTWALDDRCIQSIEASSTNVATLIKVCRRGRG